MATIHMVLQGKGGVGKSFVAAAIAQYLRDCAQSVPLCIDTDPINKTFLGYRALEVRALELMDGTEIDPRRFDTLFEQILSAGSDQHIVVDNGASSFVPLADYLLSAEVPKLVQAHGHRLQLHSVITGGQALWDTLEGLKSLLELFPDVPLFVWLNPVHGKVQHEGKSFEDFAVYKDHKDRIQAVIRIPELNPKTSGRDLSDMLADKVTFKEAVDDGSRQLMQRQRLRMIQRDLYASIACSALC